MKTRIQIAILTISIFAANTATAQRNENRPPRPLPEELVADMIVNHDANENDSLDKTELSKALEDMRKLHRRHRGEMKKQHAQSHKKERANQKPKMDLEKLITRFDKDNDHELNTEELLSMLDHMHHRRMHSNKPPARSS